MTEYFRTYYPSCTLYGLNAAYRVPEKDVFGDVASPRGCGRFPINDIPEASRPLRLTDLGVAKLPTHATASEWIVEILTSAGW
jgi:hypothetical protein